MGWVEQVIVKSGNFTMKAKLDSGAKTSSIRAKILKEFEKDGIKWIQFQITGPDKKKVKIEREVERWVRIKSKKRGFVRRPVVRMEFCIGNKLIEEEVNLSSRPGFVYPILIGRNMLQGHIIIDASRTLTQQPHCE